MHVLILLTCAWLTRLSSFMARRPRAPSGSSSAWRSRWVSRLLCWTHQASIQEIHPPCFAYPEEFVERWPLTDQAASIWLQSLQGGLKMLHDNEMAKGALVT